MTAFWVTFTSGQGVCVEAESKGQARRLVENEVPRVVRSIEQLPYPATPRVGLKTDCPAFCYTPNTCKGRSACPRRPSCTS